MKRNNPGAGTICTLFKRPMISHGEGGFTLMEVVAALFIFLMGIVGVISLFAAATVLHKNARDKTMAALAIQQVLSEIEIGLKSGEFRDGNGDLKPIKDAEVFGYDRYRYQVEFSEEMGMDQSMVVARVVLTWREKGRTRGEEFDVVFRSGPGIFQSIGSFKKEKERPGEEAIEEGG